MTPYHVSREIAAPPSTRLAEVAITAFKKLVRINNSNLSRRLERTKIGAGRSVRLLRLTARHRVANDRVNTTLST